MIKYEQDGTIELRCRLCGKSIAICYCHDENVHTYIFRDYVEYTNKILGYINENVVPVALRQVSDWADIVEPWKNYTLYSEPAEPLDDECDDTEDECAFNTDLPKQISGGQ
ncbi:MAG: hypothetical protein RR365_09015 [Bacteroides sp.]